MTKSGRRKGAKALGKLYTEDGRLSLSRVDEAWKALPKGGEPITHLQTGYRIVVDPRVVCANRRGGKRKNAGRKPRPDGRVWRSIRMPLTDGEFLDVKAIPPDERREWLLELVSYYRQTLDPGRQNAS